ncbi:MAG: hypothetical protein H7239_10250 [Flavobacterium sp.]|nr:hypothetical protein [Flavobacterium sp.]
MTQYNEILENLKNGICNYSNELTLISYSLGKSKMKIDINGDLVFFTSLEKMARSINKFIKTGV